MSVLIRKRGTQSSLEPILSANFGSFAVLTYTRANQSLEIKRKICKTFLKTTMMTVLTPQMVFPSKFAISTFG